jgi:hypothetical protein
LDAVRILLRELGWFYDDLPPLRGNSKSQILNPKPQLRGHLHEEPPVGCLLDSAPRFSIMTG